MSRFSRRQILNRGVTLLAGGVAAPYLIPAGVLRAGDQPGANERVGVGAIGVGRRASVLLDQLPGDGRIVALCDCNLSQAESFKAAKKASWPVLQDYRNLLDRKDIDAVIIATGEFQRVLPCIHACLAGKDIYAEKPLTLYIEEGRALVKAVRRCSRVFQVGSQQRSMAMNQVACELVRTGGLGKVLEVRAVNYTSCCDPPARGFPEQPIPAGLSWDMWLNQLSWRPFNHQWLRWLKVDQWREFGGGETTNWGAHGVDQIQWALGMDGTGPREVRPLGPGAGGQLGVEMRYANGVPVRFVLEKTPMGGGVFVCEKGKLEINRNTFASNPKSIVADLLKKVDAAEEKRMSRDEFARFQAPEHLQNWLDCVKNRRRPVADVEIGHRSITVCHLINICRQVKRRLQWDPEKELFVGDEQANKFLTRPRRKGYELPA